MNYPPSCRNQGVLGVIAYGSYVLHSVALLARSVEWPLVLGVFYLLLVTALAVALGARHYARRRMLSEPPSQHIFSRYLPVVYLTPEGRVGRMALSPSEYVVYASIYHSMLGKKHALCTDLASWSNFCAFAASEAYRRMSGGSGTLGRGGESDGSSLSYVMESSLEDVQRPYLRRIFLTFTDLPRAELEGLLNSIACPAGLPAPRGCNSVLVKQAPKGHSNSSNKNEAK
uniref:Wsv021-like protein n=1 Tax=Sicyonia whispovirus TaxID=2984283 RepID=A0A9C7F0W6_9VIRU|nr:MAG: wsv021-like protein [Sicyonia whispovirus]